MLLIKVTARPYFSLLHMKLLHLKKRELIEGCALPLLWAGVDWNRHCVLSSYHRLSSLHALGLLTQAHRRPMRPRSTARSRMHRAWRLLYKHHQLTELSCCVQLDWL